MTQTYHVPNVCGIYIITVLKNISSFTSPSRSISPSFAMSSIDFGHYFSLPGRDDYGEEREGKDGKVEKCA